MGNTWLELLKDNPNKKKKKTTKTMKRVDLKKILYMEFLIRHNCTGTSKEFAAKMDMSRSTLFEYIAYMRDELEVCILFDKFLGTYYYDGKNLYTSLGFKVVG